jgi:hypothetical protein
MTDKLVVILSSAELGVAQTGLMYAVNALKNGWMADVRLFFFGPAQELLTRDPELQRLLAVYMELGRSPVACKYIADRDQTLDSTADLGVSVDYVGTMISELIHQGYIPMVW